MSAQVIELFPQPKKSCWDCLHGMWGAGGVYCSLYNEQILSETLAAADCEEYEPDDTKT